MKPKCILTIGITGSGKSMMGQKIAKEKNYTLLDKDTMTTSLVELLLAQLSPTKDPQDRESTYYMDVIRPIAYEGLFQTAIENLKLGNNVIIAADFHQELSDPYFLSKSEYFTVIKEISDITVIDITVDHPTLLKRIIARNEPRDAWKIANWATYVKEVADAKIEWTPADFTYVRFDNSDTLPILQEMSFKNLLSNI